MNSAKKSWHNSPANKTVLPDWITAPPRKTWKSRYPNSSLGASLDILHKAGFEPEQIKGYAAKMEQAVKNKDVWALYELGAQVQLLVRNIAPNREKKKHKETLERVAASRVRRGELNKERGHTPEQIGQAVAAWQQHHRENPQDKARTVDRAIARRFGVHERTIRKWKRGARRVRLPLDLV